MLQKQTCWKGGDYTPLKFCEKAIKLKEKKCHFVAGFVQSVKWYRQSTSIGL